jgi:hypothetical protein
MSPSCQSHSTDHRRALCPAFHDENWHTARVHSVPDNDGSSATAQAQEPEAELHIAEINRLRKLYNVSQAELLAERAAKRRAEDEIDKERAIRRRLEDEVWALRVKHKLG